MIAKAAPTSNAAPTPSRHRWMLPTLLIGQAMAALDTSIVNVAAPALRRDLHISSALLQIVIAGYVLAYAVLLVIGARLGDDHGYRRTYVLGVTVFTIASLVCGVAPGTTALVVARVVQGVGAALMVPQVLSLIQRHFEGADRARAVGYYSMILALGVTVGQLLGGVIVTVDVLGLSWRPAFLINVPFGLLLILTSRTVLPDTRGTVQRKLDIAGAVALSLSMLLVVIPLTFGREVHWQTWTWVCLGLGFVGLVGFGLVEKRVARSGGDPLLHFEAVFSPGVKAGLLTIFIAFAGYGGLLFSMALYLQAGLGLSPISSGLVFSAYALGFGATNLTWSKLPAQRLRWTPTVALVVMVLADVGFGLVARRWGWTPALMLPLLLVAGSGHGLSFGPSVNQVAARVPPPHAPAVSGLVTTTVQLSIVVGIAALGTLYLATSSAGSPEASSSGISTVAFAIAIAGLVAIACSVRLAASKHIACGIAAPSWRTRKWQPIFPIAWRRRSRTSRSTMAKRTR